MRFRNRQKRHLFSQVPQHLNTSIQINSIELFTFKSPVSYGFFHMFNSRCTQWDDKFERLSFKNSDGKALAGTGCLYSLWGMNFCKTIFCMLRFQIVIVKRNVGEQTLERKSSFFLFFFFLEKFFELSYFPYIVALFTKWVVMHSFIHLINVLSIQYARNYSRLWE